LKPFLKGIEAFGRKLKEMENRRAGGRETTPDTTMVTARELYALPT
jgi:hypothetical protein